MAGFVHLHLHTEYSLLDGASRISEVVERAAELSQSAVAITDHGVMFGAASFYKEAKKRGVKPIIGCEVYTTAGSMTDKLNMRDYSHLILLAKNNVGYKNLMKIVSLGYTDGFYYKPRVDHDVLKKYHEGLICLSGCIAGEVASYFIAGQSQRAYDTAKWFKSVFKDDYYIEIQDHGLSEEKLVLPMLVKLANELDIPLAATNDAHYVKKEDASAQDVLLCIQTASYIGENKMSFGTNEFYMKSEKEMAELFPHIPEALENTVKIAEKCNVELDFGTYHLPKFDVPEGYTNTEYLRKLTFEGIEKRYGSVDELRERTEYELKTINEMGFTDYFLIVWDFINFAKTHGIAVGPGRGSAAGSVVAYALRITDIDPIRYDLLFERFLNPERISMPDIDIDFCFERRGEVIDYVVNKYGEDRVAQIITFGTLGAKQVVRDVARVMRISVGEADRIAKMIPFELKMTIKKAIERSAKLRAEYEGNDQVREWLTMAMRLEGLPRQAGTHAAGVLISKEPVTEYAPLTRNKKDDSITTQYDKDILEELGLLKMDFLGLRTLTVIRDALNTIKETRGIEIDIDNIDLCDKSVYDMIAAGSTDGVFQLESAGMRDVMTRLRPEKLEDIMVGISLFRPGPMAKIPDYIRGKNAPGSVKYDHEVLEKVLGETYGCMVYQEQVMQIVRDMAGYSMGRSDLVRRAMAKKKADVMEKERHVFMWGDGEGVEGAVARGVPESVADRVFGEMMDFAEYAFNKSHACAYAVVAYQTAYLKRHYEPELLTALLNVYNGDPKKFSLYVNYLSRSNITLLPPDINLSEKGFTVQNGAVRFGLCSLKNVGESTEYVIKERENGKFTSFQDFVYRCISYINKGQMESLILSGCFDSLNPNRAQLMAGYDMVYRAAYEKRKQEESGQLSFFDMAEAEPSAAVALPEVEDYSERERLKLEKERTGVYLSGHPLKEYAELLSKQKYNIAEVADSGRAAEFDGLEVTLTGIISGVKVRSTKNKQQMANITFEDLTDTMNVIAFPKSFLEFESVIETDSVVTITGRIAVNEDAPSELILSNIRKFTAMQPKRLFVRAEIENAKINAKLRYLIEMHKGKDEVIVYSPVTKKKYRYPVSANINEELMHELKQEFGTENIALK